MPKISVIVPVYKVEQYLNRCVDSILNQTFKDFEIILVDDGSPDNCPAICDDYAAKYDFIHVIHKENGGLSDARNYGIDWAFKNSDSEWMTFIDSDDWVHKQYLEILYNGVVQNNVKVSCCYLQKIREFCENKPITLSKQYVDKPEKLYCNNILEINSSAGRLFYKKLFYDIRFPKGQLLEDQATIYKILFSVEKVCVFTMPLYYYFVNPNGIMSNYLKDDSLKLLSLNISLIMAKWFYKNRFFDANKKVMQEVFNVTFQICDYLCDDVEKCKLLEKSAKSVRKKILKETTDKKRKLFREDIALVKQEKGFLYTCFWILKNVWKFYF